LLPWGKSEPEVQKMFDNKGTDSDPAGSLKSLAHIESNQKHQTQMLKTQ
jgi:hypothetical protein